jgi:hypothetical protein
MECCCLSLVRSKDRGNAWEFEKTGAVDRISGGSGCTAVGRGHTITQALPRVLSSEQTEKIKSPTWYFGCSRALCNLLLTCGCRA